jgi:hypothetical protein
MVTQNLDDVSGESLHSTTWPFLRYGCSIAPYRTWSPCALWRDPFYPRSWLDAQDRSSPPWLLSCQVIPHPHVSSSTSLAMIRGRYHELLPTMVVISTCITRFHTSQVWERVQCSEVLIFLSLQTSSRPSWVKLLDTHDFQLQTPRVGSSCLHSFLGVTLQPLSCLEYDWVSPRPPR